VSLLWAVVGVTQVLDHIKRSECVVHLRRPKSGEAGAFERTVAEICSHNDYPVVWHSPLPGGRGAVYVRDYEMVEASDTVIAFFSEGNIMTGGTGHVVDAALMKEIPVAAWEVGRSGFYHIGAFSREE
jgi:hypothetical protein